MISKQAFTKQDLPFLCNQLAQKDKDLLAIITEYGYPPFWTRPATFATLIYIILEQQVSLASAKAAFIKLKQKLGHITPQKLLTLSDEELRACYFSRQKTGYARNLAQAIVSKEISLSKLSHLPDDEIRVRLKKLKGIGDWTVDIYLLFALHRTNIFPTGDLAMMNAFKWIRHLPKHTTKEEIIAMAESWQPYRSIATMLLWHYYIKKRGIRI